MHRPKVSKVELQERIYIYIYSERERERERERQRERERERERVFTCLCGQNIDRMEERDKYLQ